MSASPATFGRRSRWSSDRSRPDEGAAISSQVLDLTGEVTPIRALLAGLSREWRLLPMLARQDFHARYRSASLGVAWTVVMPLLQGAVLAVVFTHVVRIQTDVSYPVFVIAGMNAWSYFSMSLSAGSTAIVEQGSLAGKVYFPRMLLPAVPALANAVGFAIAMAVTVLLMLVLRVPLHPSLLLLPVAMAVVALLAALVAEVTSLLHVYFRDTRYVITALLLVLFYGTPVIYPLSKAGALTHIVEANPVTGAIQLLRWTLFGRIDHLAAPLAVTGCWLVCLTGLSLLAYRRHERIAVDRL